MLRRLRRARRGLFAAHAGDLIRVAWPIAIAMLGQSAMGLVDVLLVARLGADALAGVGVAVILAHLVFAAVFGLMRGVKVLSARAHGAREAGAVRFALAGAVVGALLGLSVWLVGRDALPLFRVLRVEEQAAAHGAAFFDARSWGAPLACALAALIQYRQGLGDARLPMLVGLGGNVINAAVSYVLAQRLGVAGVGYGTAVAEGCQLLALGAVVARDVRIGWSDRARGWFAHAVRELSRVGLPTGLQFAFEMLAFVVLTVILSGIGAREVAAHYVALNIVRFAVLPAFALSEAGCVLVGHSLGRRLPRRAQRFTRAGLLLAVGVAGAVGLGLVVFGAPVSDALSDDPLVAGLVRRLLVFAALFLALDAAYMVYRGALRAAEDVRWPGLVGAALAWVCIPGAALILGSWVGWGAVGAWCGFLLETVLGVVLLSRRWGRLGPARVVPAPV